jgi:hypothetical protein
VPRRGRWFWIGILGLIACPGALHARIDLQLRIPPAETYVLGDAIPLYWQFLNTGQAPLGFMWEGCCRVNGRLTVRQNGRDLDVYPPQMNLFHTFAKADRLEPGQPKEYDTRVGDWVVLPGTGAYELSGFYQGVLTNQFPIVPRGLGLWRDAANSAPATLSVLGVADYLAQRDERTRRRGLRVTVEGPTDLPPLTPASFRVQLENVSERPVSLTWPDDEALWILNERNERVAPTAVLPGTATPLVIPVGGKSVHTFELTSDRFESEPLGNFRWFIDVHTGPNGEPRVPSNVLPLSWNLTPVQVADLVQQAAEGARTGARNAPLKLLRVYLAQLGPALANLDTSGFSTAAELLRDRLARAARIKTLSPTPGPVDISLSIPERGPVQWMTPTMRTALAGAGGATGTSRGSGFNEAELDLLLDLRRHLGWDITLVLEPAETLALAVLEPLAGMLHTRQRDLAGPPVFLLPTGGTNAPARLSWSVARSGAQPPTLRLTTTGIAWAPDGQSFLLLPNTAALTDRLRTEGWSGVARIQADPALPWGRVRHAAGALARPGGRLELVLSPPDQG